MPLVFFSSSRGDSTKSTKYSKMGSNSLAVSNHNDDLIIFGQFLTQHISNQSIAVDSHDKSSTNKHKTFTITPQHLHLESMLQSHIKMLQKYKDELVCDIQLHGPRLLWEYIQLTMIHQQVVSVLMPYCQELIGQVNTSINNTHNQVINRRDDDQQPHWQRKPTETTTATNQDHTTQSNELIKQSIDVKLEPCQQLHLDHDVAGIMADKMAQRIKARKDQLAARR